METFWAEWSEIHLSSHSAFFARAMDPRTMVYGEEEIILFFSQNGKIIEGVSIILTHPRCNVI